MSEELEEVLRELRRRLAEEIEKNNTLCQQIADAKAQIKLGEQEVHTRQARIQLLQELVDEHELDEEPKEG